MLFLILSATLSKNFPQADATEIEGKMRNRLKLIRIMSLVLSQAANTGELQTQLFTSIKLIRIMSPVLSQAANTGELQTQLFTSISKEAHELKEISQYLKEQFLAIDSKIDILLKREEQRLSSKC